MSISNEDYLDGLIAKAKKSWEGVDVERYMSDLRDDSFDKEVAENLSKEVASYITEQAKCTRLKIIEERADQYVTRPLIPDSTIPADVANEKRDAYFAGAKDQQYIDRLLIEQLIDKACEWFADYLMEIGYPDDWMRDSPNMESGKERFIKAMEKAMEE